MVISMFLYQTKTIITTYDGFALDSNGVLYVGEAKGIATYENGKFVKIIHEENSLSFAFTIQDDKLYAATGYRVEVMDLSGNLIETIDDSNSQEMYKLYRQRNSFVTDDALYIATNKLGYYKITKHNNGEGEIIFQTPIVDYIFGTAKNIIPIICVIIFFTGYIKWLQKK